MRVPNASRRNRGRNNNIRRNGSSINKVFDGNGSENRVKGNALQVHEKYQAMARDAKSSGDRIKAENYLQHVDHFERLVSNKNSNQNESNSQTVNVSKEQDNNLSSNNTTNQDSITKNEK